MIDTGDLHEIDQEMPTALPMVNQQSGFRCSEATQSRFFVFFRQARQGLDGIGLFQKI